MCLLPSNSDYSFDQYFPPTLSPLPHLLVLSMPRLPILPVPLSKSQNKEKYIITIYNICIVIYIIFYYILYETYDCILQYV